MASNTDLTFVGNIFGYVAGVLTVIAILPQIYTVCKTRDARTLSIAMVICLWVVSVLNLVFGILTLSFPLILTNIGTILAWTILFILAIYFTYIYKGNYEII